jgi:hypothetical protein
VSESIEAFPIRVDDAVLRDLHHRLVRTRFPDQIEDTGWEYGIPVDYLRELVAYWSDTYDWRSVEARLNTFEHFRTTIDGQRIHFIHPCCSPTAGRAPSSSSSTPSPGWSTRSPMVARPPMPSM